MTEDDMITFGEHNVSATNLAPTKVLECFPWQDYFSLVGIEGQYPAILYSDDEADALYEVTSSLLVFVGSGSEAGYDLSITFEDQPDLSSPRGSCIVGHMQIALRLKEPSMESLNASRLSLRNLRGLIFRAIALYHMYEESYGQSVQITQEGEEGCYFLTSFPRKRL